MKQREQVENKIAEVREKAKKREEVERERMERRKKLAEAVAME